MVLVCGSLSNFHALLVLNMRRVFFLMLGVETVLFKKENIKTCKNNFVDEFLRIPQWFNGCNHTYIQHIFKENIIFDTLPGNIVEFVKKEYKKSLECTQLKIEIL
uniref:Uncharacterized protein n=1 Tax=Megaselia scalaris TaxID=36166 RepID=T1GIR3_MEGSC